MSASKHTPGPWWGGVPDSPWYVRRESDDACIAHMEDGGHCDPSIVLISDDEREANARLIAAAPDLLEAAEDSIDILDVAIDLWNASYPHEQDEVLTDLQRRFRAAIAKARGQ